MSVNINYLCRINKHLFFIQCLKNNSVLKVGKYQGSEITSVAWNYDHKIKSTSGTTGPILLGNSSGTIIETQLGTEFDRFFQGSFIQYWKEVTI